VVEIQRRLAILPSLPQDDTIPIFKKSTDFLDLIKNTPPEIRLALRKVAKVINIMVTEAVIKDQRIT